jgi:hypothetical protein
MMTGRAKAPRNEPRPGPGLGDVWDRRTAVTCKHCGTPVRPCRCHGHPGPMWHHWPARYHRCGPDGRGATFAEPA